MPGPTRFDDAPTTMIARADLRRAARGQRGLVIGAAVAATVALLVVAGVALGAIGRSSDPAPTAAPAVVSTTSADPSTPATAAEVPVGGVLFEFSGSNSAQVTADGHVVAVLDDTSTLPGRTNKTLVTYDQRTGARLAGLGPGLPEILDCGVRVVRRPDGTSVVLTRYDTEVPATGVQLGTGEAHVAARDGRTLQPLWDAVLRRGDTNDEVLSLDTVCSGPVQTFFPTTDGRFVLSRSFDVSRLIDLTTGALRAVPFAVNVMGDDVVVAVPPPSTPGEGVEPDKTGPSTFDAVRVLASDDLRVLSTVTDPDVAQAFAEVGDPGRPTRNSYTSGGADSRYTEKSLSGDARTMAMQDDGRVVLLDVPTARVKGTITPDPRGDGLMVGSSISALAIVPGRPGGQDVVLIGTPGPNNGPISQNAYAAFDLSGRRLWSLPAGAARGICLVDPGVLLLDAAGLTSLDPVSGRQIAVDEAAACPAVTAGLAVTSIGGGGASNSTDYTVRVLHRP